MKETTINQTVVMRVLYFSYLPSKGLVDSICASKSCLRRTPNLKKKPVKIYIVYKTTVAFKGISVWVVTVNIISCLVLGFSKGVVI